MTPSDPELLMMARQLEAISSQLVTLAKRIEQVDDESDERLREMRERLREQLAAHVAAAESYVKAAIATMRIEAMASDADDDEKAIALALKPYDHRLSTLEKIAWVQFVAVIGTAGIVVWQSLINPPRPIPGGTVPYQQERTK